MYTRVHHAPIHHCFYHNKMSCIKSYQIQKYKFQILIQIDCYQIMFTQLIIQYLVTITRTSISMHLTFFRLDIFTFGLNMFHELLNGFAEFYISFLKYLVFKSIYFKIQMEFYIIYINSGGTIFFYLQENTSHPTLQFVYVCRP